MRRRRVLPGFGLSLGTSVLFVSLVLLLPMTALVVQLSELTWAQYWAILTHPQTTAAFRVTILSAFWASVINALLGLLLAWILVRYRRFLGEQVGLLYHLSYSSHNLLFI
jgi:sulfate transport system permease protein